MSKYKLCEGCDTRMPKDFNYPVFCGRCLDDIQEQGRSDFRAEVEKVLINNMNKSNRKLLLRISKTLGLDAMKDRGVD